MLLSHARLHTRLHPALEIAARTGWEFAKLNSVFAVAVGPGHSPGKLNFVLAAGHGEANAEQRAEAQGLVHDPRRAAAAHLLQRGLAALTAMPHRHRHFDVGA